jgi:hypothetical protein
MLKKNYIRGRPGYFNNYVNASDPKVDIGSSLKEYQATLAKSKPGKLNVKWHDKELYMLFVLRFS